MKPFNTEQREEIKNIVNQHLNGSAIINSIELSISQPTPQYGDVGSELEDFILYDVKIIYNDEITIQRNSMDLSEDVRDAATILTEIVEQEL